MTENPDYWNTIATVIPVIALTYTTAFKRSDWHRMPAIARRWTALYGACLVGLLVWVEIVSLGHLEKRTTDSLDERLSGIVVAWIAAQVLAVPIAPLMVIALHDFHPTVLQAKRRLKKDKLAIAQIRHEYQEVMALYESILAESLLEGMEQVLRKPELAYTESGSVRTDYLNRVSKWGEGQHFKTEISEAREDIEQKFAAAEKQLNRSQKRLAKALRIRTKNAAKATDLHR